MIPRGPRFLDQDDLGPEPSPVSGMPAPDPIASAVAEDPVLPRGPVLLEPEPDAAGRLELGWTPEAVRTPRTRIGAGLWVAAGLCTIVVTWLVLSAVSFVLVVFQQSIGLGGLAALAILLGLAMMIYGALLEMKAYRSLGTVERLRATLSAAETTVTAARQSARAWLGQIGAGVPDVAAVDRMLQAAATVAEVRAVLRSQVADRLRERARSVGRRAAAEGATLVAICPHPALDGVIAGGRGLHLIRQIAAVYGLRPGLAVTLALVRRVAWTAAGTTGLGLVSQGLAQHVLASMPVIKHVAGALPEPEWSPRGSIGSPASRPKPAVPSRIGDWA